MQLDTLFSASGADRSEHAANIQNADTMRDEYNKLHEVVFANAKLKKYVIVNSDGNVVEKAAALDLLTNANGTVRHEDFMVIQDKIVEVRRRALNGVADLMSSGLTFGVSIEEQLVGFENVNEFREAEQAMNPNTQQNNNTVFTEEFVPNPITHQSFSVPWRQTGFNYKRSLGMSESIRQVAEKLENTLFNGNSKIAVQFNGVANPIYGYTNHPKRGTGTISDWSLIANIETVVPETITQVGAMFSGQGGIANDSVIMYVSNDFWTNLQNDYKADSEKSALTRLLEIPQIKDVKAGEKLAAKSAVMVEMLERTVQMAIASDIITVPHIKTTPMAPQVLTTYAAMVQQIKSDSKGNTGVRHLTV